MDEKRTQRLIAAVVVAALALSLAWVGYSLAWIKKRHEALGASELFKMTTNAGPDEFPTRKWDASATAPAGLWLFGEKGVGVYFWTHASPDIEECRRLFPEAEVVRGQRPGADEP